MAERNEKVMEKVRNELEADPTLKSKPLYEQMQKVDKSIKDLSVQQFHARYVLPIKRENAPKRPRKRRTAGQAAGGARGRKARMDRDQVRGAFLKFARDLAEAESRGQIVQVMTNMDSYIDQATGQTS